MKYVGQPLPKKLGNIIAVWDYTCKAGELGTFRWLLKSVNGELILYWCEQDYGNSPGHTSNVSKQPSNYWLNFSKEFQPVWGKTSATEGVVCECGGDKTKTPHSDWCPKY